MRFLNVITLMIYLSVPIEGLLFTKRAPSPWFNEYVALQPFDLPPGVSIELVKTEEGIAPKEYILIKNKTSTDLYIAGTNFSMVNSEEVSTEFVRKIVNGQVYRWESEWVEESSSSYNPAWFPPEEVRKNAVWLYVYGNQINTDDALVVKLQPLNQFDGNRPQNVKIPDPQKIFLPVFYEKNEIRIPITIFYTLNLDYHPARFNIIAWMISWIQGQTLFGCLVSIVIPLLFLTGLIARLFKNVQERPAKHSS